MKTTTRVVVTALAVAALGVGTGGVAFADTPVWVLPGVDLGGPLGPTTGVPGALAPLFDLFKLIGA
ncbi:hypothetical protein [Saccharothrix syringae]|uniref:Uncharacterized protein n=1 Tax=Saccharothrix syringae TaxID=103733 RepID=A0A5Q0GW03_SACSY|nr:hypothetical protein [Saccharothrix syringae]QFZ17825.1 hypothetical protein EKG83_10335 [Saccharothrix syringae]